MRFPSPFPLLALLLPVLLPMLLPVLLMACAGRPAWVNPALPKERWDADYVACRRATEDLLPPSSRSEPGEERNGNPMRLVDRYDARRNFDAGVESCMRGRGYVPAQ